MRVNSLPSSLLSFFMILQSGKSSILRSRISSSRDLQGVIRGRGATETLLLVKRRMIREVMTRSSGEAEETGAVLGKKPVEFRVFRLHDGADDEMMIMLF